MDPVTLEVIRNRLDIIAEEMQLALVRSSYSHTVKEAEDASSALFDVAGETIAQATALPIHLGMLVPAVRRILEVFPPETMQDGDAYIMNDPYQGGTHIPDLTLVVPILYRGRTIALSCNMAHHQDMGGKTPGSTPTDSTEIFQEGLIIPPIKLLDRGERNRTFYDILASNVRVPDLALGDLGGQLACGAVGRRRFLETVDEFGLDVVLDAMRELMEKAEAMTRACIAQIPDGRYRFTDFLDNDGIELDRPLQICATVTIQGSDITVDFEGTSPQARGPLNAVPSPTVAAVYYVIRAITDPSIPNNGGCFRVAKINLPEASLVNPTFPAPVNARTATVKRIADTLFGALAAALPERIPAAPSGVLTPIFIGGRDPAKQQTFVVTDSIVGGMGGRPGKDGISTIDTDVTNVGNVPVEALELHYPLRVRFNRLRPASAGAGRFRGGQGLERCLELLRGEATASIRGERHFFQPWGLFGGKPGAFCETTIYRHDGGVERIPSKRVVTLRAGDRLELRTAGGGGHGDPLGRDPDLVLADVLDRKITREQAEADYGVVLKAGGKAVDHEQTDVLRTELARRAGPRDGIYDRGDIRRGGG
jgi:N-methylhydantoinase B